MSTVLREKPHLAADPVEAYYTICPVLVASNIAVELGWLDEEFKRVGGKATYLRSLPDNGGWLPHYRHSLNPLFRDGGAIPTLWAKADLTDTTLIATTASQRAGQVVVRAGSGIRRVQDLAGRRIGLFKSQNDDKIDFSRATAQHGLLLALELAGLNAGQVEWVDLADDDDPSFLQPSQRPVELWTQLKAHRSGPAVDIQALAENRVDAILVQASTAASLVASGEYTVIEDLERYTDWTLKISNGPYTTAVNTDFARQHPELVVAFLRAAIRAGRWINANPAAAAELFTRVTFNSDPALVRAALQGRDFVPQLSAQNLAALELKKRFLREHGYIKGDFRVADWADASFLQQAHASLAH